MHTPMNPNDYLKVQLRVGSKRVDVINGAGRTLLTAEGSSDRQAIRKLSDCVDALIKDRQEVTHE